ncbi:hypothetical protein EVAR_6464_1 [Eumeta japonica]|uniref:Uncharacterized protein n=1 Tax=Eumeta variegata TaxID=151549 RepID=A0A4C1SSJ6_EUMVA|nr:hypothetical protein EVAR_6464_1 [Eumeta japonica]
MKPDRASTLTNTLGMHEKRNFKYASVPVCVTIDETELRASNAHGAAAALECELASKVARARNSDVREWRGVKEDVVTRIKRVVLRWFGHLEKMDENRLTKPIGYKIVSDSLIFSQHDPLALRKDPASLWMPY